VISGGVIRAAQRTPRISFVTAGVARSSIRGHPRAALRPVGMNRNPNGYLYGRTVIGEEGDRMRAAAGRGEGHQHPVDPDRVAAARARLLQADDAARLAGLLGLLADPVRARILYALDVVQELCVGDLAIALEASEDAVGYGLRILRTAGLVTNRRAGRVVYYRLADEFPEPLLEHCLRQLVTLSRHAADETARPDRD
jgi:ArsR family transcriptional regulator, lead/cadmium/zinc/bismuth-responsive transcriptional repressor